MKKNVNVLFLFFCIFFSIVCCSKKQNTEFNISTLYGTWLIDKVIPLNVISTDSNEYLGKTISIDKDLGIKNTTINNTTVEVIDNNKKKRFSIISSSKIQIFIVGNNYYIMKSI